MSVIPAPTNIPTIACKSTLPVPGSRYAYAFEIDKCPKINEITVIGKNEFLNFILKWGKYVKINLIENLHYHS